MSKFRKGSLVALFALAVGAAGFKLSTPLWATDVEGATKTLQDAGLTPVKVGGYHWCQYSKNDRSDAYVYGTKFTATNKDGRVVEGAVTKGLFKGSTIRYN